MKPTISELARQCNVSRGTIDRVIHDRAHVSPEVLERVEAALAESGYVSPRLQRRQSGKSTLTTIAIVIPEWQDYFARQTCAGINQAEHSIHDAQFCVITRKMKTRAVSEYLSIMDELAESGVRGIVLNAAQDSLIEMKIDELAERDIAVVTYDGDVMRSRRVCYIGQDIYQSGEIAAGLMARFMRPHDEVLIVAGYMQYECSKGRVDGFVRYLQSQGLSPDCYQLAECYERFDLTSATVRQALLGNPRLRYIYMANENVTGCVDGVRRAQCTHPIHIICNDLTPAAKKYLLSGQIDFVIGQDFAQKAYKAIMVLYQLLRSGIKPKKTRQYTDSFIISRELL